MKLSTATASGGAGDKSEHCLPIVAAAAASVSMICPCEHTNITYAYRHVLLAACCSICDLWDTYILSQLKQQCVLCDADSMLK